MTCLWLLSSMKQPCRHRQAHPTFSYKAWAQRVSLAEPVSKMLAMQMHGSELDPQSSCGNLGVARHTCNPSTVWTETSRSIGLVSTQPFLSGHEFSVPVRDPAQYHSAHKCICTHICPHPYTAVNGCAPPRIPQGSISTPVFPWCGRGCLLACPGCRMSPLPSLASRFAVCVLA